MCVYVCVCVCVGVCVLGVCVCNRCVFVACLDNFSLCVLNVSIFGVGSLRKSCDLCTSVRPGRHAQYTDAAPAGGRAWPNVLFLFCSECLGHPIPYVCC